MLLRIATALALFLLAGCASGPPEGLTEMMPAYAAQEALAPVLDDAPQIAPLDLAFPEDGRVFSETAEAYVAGQLVMPAGVSDRVDAVIVIDTSSSTGRNTLARATDPGVLAVRGPHRRGHFAASILEVELASALLLLANADPGKTQLGVVTFAGVDPRKWPPQGGNNARTEVPLTRDLEAVAKGIHRIGLRPAAGRTDMAAGLNQAISELVGRGRPQPDPRARKVVIFLTDGQPTLPSRRVEDNEAAVILAAQRASGYGVRIFSFAVGPEALKRPLATVEMARRTGGVFTPVRAPRDLATAVIQTVRFKEFDELAIRNATLGIPAHSVERGDDGTFEALVPLKPGKNRISIRAQMGSVSARAERIVHYAPGTVRAVPRDELKIGREIDIRAADPKQRRMLEVYIRGRGEAGAVAARPWRNPDVAAPPPE